MRVKNGRAGGFSVMEDITATPGFLFVDHVAIAVKQGELEQQVQAYKKLGFSEVHREDVLGSDQVREVLLQIGKIGRAHV